MINFRCFVRGLRTNKRNLVAEMIEMRKFRTTFMVEKCRNRNEAVMCPKPQRQNIRSQQLNIAGQLSNIFAGKLLLFTNMFLKQRKVSRSLEQIELLFRKEMKNGREVRWILQMWSIWCIENELAVLSETICSWEFQTKLCEQ
ncbi:hypothetical protein MKX03_007539 [Papaver bracteatum]|nr:hypothetical protein MKX03_007539 [Papaver bracteatum]